MLSPLPPSIKEVQEKESDEDRDQVAKTDLLLFLGRRGKLIDRFLMKSVEEDLLALDLVLMQHLFIAAVELLQKELFLGKVLIQKIVLLRSLYLSWKFPFHKIKNVVQNKQTVAAGDLKAAAVPEQTDFPVLCPV